MTNSIAVEPRVDRDTAEVEGTPDIARTILDKIDAASVFVCDLSLINGGAPAGQRPTPNPNVLVELGWAAKALGWNRVLTVFNTASGDVEDLPFDLKQKRAIVYRAEPDEVDRSTSKKALAKQLEAGLRAIFAKLDATPVPPPLLSDNFISPTTTTTSPHRSERR